MSTFFFKYSKYMLYSPKFPFFYFQTELSLSDMHPCLHGLISSALYKDETRIKMYTQRGVTLRQQTELFFLSKTSYLS
jgi:hypothetical protein